MPSTTNTKTLYTPVFFSSSEPPRGSMSTANANVKVPSAYLNALSRTHIALAQIVQEVPSSRPGSPIEDADGSYPDLPTQERVSALRARVQEAWAMAQGNPADGKWTLLTHLLRLGVTSGKAGRWAGTRADLKTPDAPDGGWINAVTEAEWAEWERKAGLKDKVENWKMRLETHEELVSQVIKDTQDTDNVGSSSKILDKKVVDEIASTAIPTTSAARAADSTPMPAVQPNLKLKAASKLTSEGAVTTNSNPLKDNSLFGFAVVKRSNPLAAAAGKKPPVEDVTSKPANRPPSDATTAPPADTAQAIRTIVDVPETSFLPPSFSFSQMMTSTPNAKPISSDKRKPEPIPFTASPVAPADPISSPLSSPSVTKVYGRQLLEKSTSLPAIPSTTLLPPTTPTRNCHDSANDNNKRSANRDVEHDRAVKKARTMLSLNSSPVAAFQPSTLLPTTPKRQNLPTLTELLASAKKGKKKSHSPKALKPKWAVGADVDSSSKPKFRFPSLLSPTTALEDNPYMLDPYAINHSARDLDIELDLSPTKSLSSLAGSDSEEDEDELKRQALGLDFSSSSFHPFATSTQHQKYPREGHSMTSPHSSPFLGEAGVALSLGFGRYNSQFDVAGQVDKVDKLLEKDVDYEGWLRDPSSEREDVGVEESP